MNVKKENIIKYISLFIIILFFCCVFFFCNVINSGYKLVDDHEIYYFSSIINNDNFFALFNKFMSDDGRFRPVYWLHRLSLFSIFKANFFLYYFEYFIFSILSSVLLFKILNKFIHAIPSLLIVALTFLSCEFQIYLGLGMGELFSCTLLIFALYFIVFVNEKNKKINNVLSFIFLLLAAYSKETFLIAVPFVLLFKILYENQKIAEIKEVLKNNLIYILALLIFAVVGIIANLILDNSSVNYTIVVSLKEIMNSLMTILSSVKHLVLEYVLIFVFAVVGFFNLKQTQEKKKYLTYILFGLLFLFSQLIFLSLFSKDNSLQIRYLFPAFFSGVIFLTSIIFFVNNKFLKLLICSFLFFSISYNISLNSIGMLKDTAHSNIMFNKTLEYTRNILDENDNILLIGDAIYTMEYFESLIRQYNYYDVKNVYFLPLIDKPISELNEFEKNLYDFFPNYYPNNLYNKDVAKPKVIILFKCPSKENYKKESNIDFSEYKKIQNENHYVEFYERK